MWVLVSVTTISLFYKDISTVVNLGPQRRLRAKELILLNCCAGEDSWESLGQQEIKSILKEINPDYSLKRLILKPKLLWLPDVKSRLIGKRS